MRLTETEISAIRTNILQFDPDAKIYLFGSRLNDFARGGDLIFWYYQKQ
jgi:predicted nucleotidyltransferase